MNWSVFGYLAGLVLMTTAVVVMAWDARGPAAAVITGLLVSGMTILLITAVVNISSDENG